MNAMRIYAMAKKELREVVRDRLLLGLAVFVPIVLMLIMGFGLSGDVENIPIAILDLDHSETSRELSAKLENSRYFNVISYLSHSREISEPLVDGRIRAAVIIPPQFQTRLLSGESVAIQSIIDGAISNRSGTTGAYLEATIASYGGQVTRNYLINKTPFSEQQIAALESPIRVEIRYLYNESMRIQWAMAPGVLMMMLVFSPPLLAAVGVVREKESGSINNIYASPLTRAEFLIGKLVPYVGLTSITIFFLWAIATLVLGAPFRGSFAAFYVVSVLFVTVMVTFGLLVSILVRSQIAAVLVTMILTIIPTILYSGMVTPLSSLSSAALAQARLMPASYYYRVVLSSFLKDVGLGVVWFDVLGLALFAIILFAICHFSFTKRPRQ